MCQVNRYILNLAQCIWNGCQQSLEWLSPKCPFNGKVMLSAIYLAHCMKPQKRCCTCTCV